jgi:serine/threonine-protein kinase
MVADDGAVKVLDFGIARRLDGTTITQAASVVGTAAYIAPERALGQPGDARADIYSLGCLLYAMLIGQPPFGGEISAAILHQQINAAPRPLREQRDGVSPALDALVLAMLAKSPQARPATVQAVRDELANLAGAGPIAPTAVTVPPTNSTEPTAVAVPPTNSTAPTAALASAVGATSATAPLRPARSYRHSLLADHRRRAVLMAVLTGVVALIAVAVLGAGGSGSSDSASGHRQTNPAVRQHTSAVANPASTKPSGPKPAHPSTGAPPGQGGAPPGHGGEPPGQAKKSKHDKKAKKAKP